MTTMETSLNERTERIMANSGDLYDLALAIYEVSQQCFQHYDSLHRRQHTIVAMMKVMVDKLMPAVNWKRTLEQELGLLEKEDEERRELERRLHE